MKVETFPGGPPGGTWDDLLRGRSGRRPPDRLPHEPSRDGLQTLVDPVRQATRSRPAVVDALRSYNRQVGNPAAEPLAERLQDPAAVAVIAGQQPGLFAGPLLVFAKAASAVLAARDLERAWSRPVVPLFWIHAEDHDLEEAGHMHLLEKGTPRRLSASLGPAGASLESLVVEEPLVELGREVLETAGAADSEPLLPRRKEPFPAWTARVLLELLHPMELLLLEPRVLRPLAAPLLRRAVEDVSGLDAAVEAGVRGAGEGGMPVQVPAAPGGQLFLLDSGGRRRRLRGGPRGWSAEGPGDAGTEPVEAGDLVAHPEHLSPAVLLRPAVQQQLLPVVAQVVGPSEAAYFAQLPEVFRWAGLPLPGLLPRLSVTILGTREQRTRERLGLDGAGLLSAPDRWPVPRPPPADDVAERLRAELESLLAPLKAQGAAAPGLRGPVERLARRLHKAVDEFQPAWSNQRSQAAEALRRQRHHLEQWVHPRARAQERMFGPLVVAARPGPERLGAWLASLDPWDFGHQVVVLEEQDEDG